MPRQVYSKLKCWESGLQPTSILVENGGSLPSKEEKYAGLKTKHNFELSLYVVIID